jgi:hypothetical protein
LEAKSLSDNMVEWRTTMEIAGMKQYQFAICAAVADNPGCTYAELGALLGKTPNTLRAACGTLARDGYLMIVRNAAGINQIHRTEKPHDTLVPSKYAARKRAERLARKTRNTPYDIQRLMYTFVAGPRTPEATGSQECAMQNANL